jgi:hypothetical protein
MIALKNAHRRLGRAAAAAFQLLLRSSFERGGGLAAICPEMKLLRVK